MCNVQRGLGFDPPIPPPAVEVGTTPLNRVTRAGAQRQPIKKLLLATVAVDTALATQGTSYWLNGSDLDRTTMLLPAIALVILGGIAFAQIARTLAALADAPAVAMRPLSKFLIAFLFIWGIEALLFRPLSSSWGARPRRHLV